MKCRGKKQLIKKKIVGLRKVIIKIRDFMFRQDISWVADKKLEFESVL